MTDLSNNNLNEDLTLLQKIETGRQQIKDGVFFTEEEIDTLIDSWE